MAALFFPHLDTLRFVLASGMIAPEVARGRARAGLDAHGHLWLEPELAPSREELASLARLGVQALAAGDLLTETAGCWAELLPLQPVPPDRSLPPRPVLFELPDRELARFCRLMRGWPGSLPGIFMLPGERPGRSWVVCHSAPPMLLLQCMEESGEIEPFLEQFPGIWARAGWEHPLAEWLAVPPGGTLLLRPPRAIATHPHTVPLAEAEDYRLRRQAVRPAGPAEVRPCPVAFSLVPAAETEREVVWAFRGAEVETFWEFCQRADERILRQFEVAAAAHDGEPLVVVRPVPGKIVPPYLPLPAAGFCADPRVPGLYRPACRRLRPGIRPNNLARALGLAPDFLTWLENTADGTVAACSIPVSAFRPAASLIEYLIPRIHRLQTAPSGVESFALGPFSVATAVEEPIFPGEIDLTELRAHGAAESSPELAGLPGWLTRSLERLAGRFRRSPSAPETPSASPDDGAPAPKATEGRKQPGKRRLPDRLEVKLSSADALLHGNDHAARRHELESQLLTAFPVMGPAERSRGWAELAAVYVATGNPADAAICWLNATWETEPAPTEWLEQWVHAECRAARLSSASLALDRLLEEPRSLSIARVLTAYATWGSSLASPPPGLLQALPRIHGLLDQYFEDLPARALWLARRAISRLSDGDALGLARWRDRILARLHDNGPGLDLDEPSFLRFQGTSSPGRFQTAREWLIRSRKPILDWIGRLGSSSGRLRREGLDPEVRHTSQYALLMLSWGLGCLGERSRSRDWADRARKALARENTPEPDRTVHRVLADLFLHRIRDSQEGRPPRAGWPAELRQRCESVPDENLARYAVDKFRRYSRILEPAPGVGEYRGLDMREFRGFDRLGERLQLLADRPDAATIGEEARSLIEMCDAEPISATIPRVTLTLLDLAPILDGPLIGSVLSQVVPAMSWLESWLQLGRWTDGERADRLPRYLAHLLGSAFAAAARASQWPAARSMLEYLLSRAESDVSLRTALTLASGQLFRVFRKLGFRSEAELLMGMLDPGRGEWPAKTPLLPGHLGLSVGWFAAGNEEAGDAILNEAQRRLFVTREGSDRDRTELAVAYAEALGFAPPRIALGRLEQIFQSLDRVNTTGSTNRYFTLKPLQLIDVVIRSVVTEDFSLGPDVRGWMDDDEFLIRRRIHRDMAEVLREERIV